MSTLGITITWLDRYFVSALTVDEKGVAHLSVTETETTGDPLVDIFGKYASVETPDDADLEVTLPWTVADAELWNLELVVTAKSADCAIRRRIKISALVWGDTGVATLDAAPTVDVTGTGNATATISVHGVGSTMRLELSPVDATPLIWGFEIRGQKL